MSKPASGFKDCIIAAPGCKIVSIDIAGLEAVLTGMFAKDPQWMRLATLGAHSYVASHRIGKPADLSWDDRKLSEYFEWIKKEFPRPYKGCKIGVHGGSYGMTPYGAHDRMPDIFPTLKDAEEIWELIAHVAPKLAKWKKDTINLAAQRKWLGGPGEHPYGYKFWFWDVKNYKKIPEWQYRKMQEQGKPVESFQGMYFQIALGPDAKKALSCMPQSTGAAKIKEDNLRLFVPGESENWIGDAYFGRTPLKAIIHDENLLEVPDRKVDDVIVKVVREFTRPCPEMPIPEEWGMGAFLQLGVSIKIGKSWGKMEDVTSRYYDKVTGTAADVFREEDEDDEG